MRSFVVIESIKKNFFLQELPTDVKKLLSDASLSAADCEEHWWILLGVLQFVSKRRFVNKWKDAKKRVAGVDHYMFLFCFVLFVLFLIIISYINSTNSRQPGT